MTATEPGPRIPATPLKGVVNATDEQAALIARHAWLSRWPDKTAHRRAGVEHELLVLSAAREIRTPTHKARWMPVSPGTLVPVSDVERTLGLDDEGARVFSSPLSLGVKLMVVPR